MSISILDFPNEIIAHVFSFVSHKKDRRNLALICKKFHKIVRQQSKKGNFIGLISQRRFISRRRTTPVSIFEQSDEFPFQNVHLETKHLEEFRDLWLRYGDEITHLTLKCDVNEIGSVSRIVKDLFPNLKAIIQERDDGSSFLSKSPIKYGGQFSDAIEELQFVWPYESYKELGSILMLFPGLKRLKLMVVTHPVQYEPSIQEFKNFLNQWLLKLDTINLSFYFHSVCVNLLQTLDGLDQEKLSLDKINFNLYKENVEIIEKFFSIKRHIKSLAIHHISNKAKITNLCALLDKNATIDHLSVDCHQAILNYASLERLCNVRGVKEIDFDTSISKIDRIRFTPEALSKVTEIQNFDLTKNAAQFSLPSFRNLRFLKLYYDNIGDEQLQLIVDSFPLLEQLGVSSLAAEHVGFSALKHLQHLELCSPTDLSEEYFEFAFNLPNLISLKIYNAPKLTFANIKAIISSCPKLEKIFFQDCDEITDEVLDSINQNLFYVEKITLLNATRVNLCKARFKV